VKRWILEPDRALFLLTGVGIAAFCVASANPLLAITGLPAWAAAWPLSAGPTGRPLPRTITTAMVVAAAAYTGLQITADLQNIVPAIAGFLMWLQIIKLYEPATPRDEMQQGVMSLFLVIGACLTSPSLSLGLILFTYLPLALWTFALRQATPPKEIEAGTPSRMLSRRAARSLASLGVGLGGVSLAIAVGVFVILPRDVGGGLLPPLGGGGATRQTGFTEEVNLGSAGLINESRSRVMDVVLRNEAGDTIGSHGRPLLLRGAVLDEYSDGQWRRSDRASNRDDGKVASPDQAVTLAGAAPDTPRISLDVTVHRTGLDHIFDLHRPISIAFDEETRFEFGEADGLITRIEGDASRYTVVCQPDAPLPGRSAAPIRGEDFRGGRIQEFAEGMLEDAGVPVAPDDRDAASNEEAIRVFLNAFHRRFGYTTEMAAAAPGEDPIEMFLFRRRRGHCEYFASGMAAACRSVGINARVVTGYMTVEFSPGADRYTVRESNAHAWIEAEVAPGAWRTYDPSPPDDLSVVHKPDTGLLAGLRSIRETAERWWVTWVVGFNESRREELVGVDPLGVDQLTRNVSSSSLAPSRPGGPPVIVVALLRGVIAFAATFAIGASGWRLLDWVRSRGPLWRRSGGVQAGARPVRPKFYTELERAWRRVGAARPSWRSPRAHAVLLASIDDALGRESAKVVDAYYAVRYGGRPLGDAASHETQIGLQRVAERVRSLRAERRRRHGRKAPTA